VFVATGTLDFVWLAFWLAIYRDPDRQPRVSREELAYIRSDPPDPQEKVPWLGLLRYRQTWAYIVGKSLTDPVWFFYLFWLPKFLDADFGVKLSGLAAPLVVIYVVADVGSVGGGWLSTFLIGRGWSVNRGRKTAMLAAALLIVPAALAPAAGSMWLAVVLVSVAAASHQWWSANMFTLASDLFPRKAVASVVGLGGCCAMVATVGFQRLTGVILDATGSNYTVIFIYCGTAYLLAVTAIHLLAPRLTPAFGGTPGDGGP
jgi:ACS family hexuronate transporter-like MFS transporter